LIAFGGGSEFKISDTDTWGGLFEKTCEQIFFKSDSKTHLYISYNLVLRYKLAEYSILIQYYLIELFVVRYYLVD
jgi:hypothetical protein